jgi:hypothetical protein
LAHKQFEADPCAPMASKYWVGSVTQRADPAHSHLKPKARGAAPPPSQESSGWKEQETRPFSTAWLDQHVQSRIIAIRCGFGWRFLISKLQKIITIQEKSKTPLLEHFFKGNPSWLVLLN